MVDFERGAWRARRDDRAYREGASEEQRRQPESPARKALAIQPRQATKHRRGIHAAKPREVIIVADMEQIPGAEAAQIARIAQLTTEQLDRRYSSNPPMLRGVHAKDHGCVTARFTVDANLPEHLRIGVFASPGHVYEAMVRFSNASVSEDPDSTRDQAGVDAHGSRGMAIKLFGVAGAPLLPTADGLTQDFVMINQPVFAFANVEDYLALSEILQRDNDVPNAFFTERLPLKDEQGQPTLAARRAARSREIIGRIRSHAVTEAEKGAYQNPPASPLDNRYFSAAPFLFGRDRAVRFSATPVAPALSDIPDVSDSRYLRTALRRRLSGAADVVFRFELQVRTAEDLAREGLETAIEDATVPWPAALYPFLGVATITIPPQDFETANRRALGERLTFSPWHGLAEHRPLGGINRLRRPVYQASSQRRLRPAVCPV